MTTLYRERSGVIADYPPQQTDPPPAERRVQPRQVVTLDTYPSPFVSEKDTEGTDLPVQAEALPDGLYPALLAAVQAEADEAYHIVEREGGYEALCPAHHLKATFTPTGVEITAQNESASTWTWRMALLGYGYGDTLQPAAPAELAASENWLEYRRGNVTEWYLNGPLGLEQGFLFHQPPTKGMNAEPLVLRLAVSGELLLDNGEQSLTMHGPSHTGLHYGHLYVYDACGRILPAHLELETPTSPGEQQIRIIVDDTGAMYPVTVDPLIQEQQKLIASDGATNNRFGTSVAVDGDTAIIGAQLKNSNTGAVYVFVRSGATWTQQQILTASDAATGDVFGYSVAINGNTLVIGAIGKNANTGAAYVFVRSGTTWIQQQKLTANDGAAGDIFGDSVAIHGDTAIIGAAGQTSGTGAAYVFVRSGTTWAQQQKLTASDAATGDNFGYSVGVVGDTIVVGAPNKNSVTGAAYVFVRSGTTWTQQQKLTASDAAANDEFGWRVGISGETVSIGAWGKSSNTGAAYVFTRSGTTWTQQQKLTASDAATNDSFGYSVTISGDIMVIGANSKNSGTGAAYVFIRNGTTWTEQYKLTASDGATGDAFGTSIAISGNTIIVGANTDDVGVNTDQGSAYIFYPVAPSNTGGGLYPMAWGGEPFQNDLVALRTGEKTEEVTDLAVMTPAGPLAFTRTYRQTKRSAFQFMGLGWTHNHASTLTPTSGTPNIVTIRMPNGGDLKLSETSAGSNHYVADAGSDATVDWNSGTSQYTLTLSDKSTYLFNASGQVLSRSWPSTETWTYGYTSGKLTSVSDGYGVRQLQFSYISNPGQFDDGQLWRVGDHSASGLSGGSPTGRYVEFGYVSQKNNGVPIGSPKALLSTVKDVMAKTWTYKYYGQVAGQSDTNLLDFLIEILSPNVDPTGAGGAGSPISLQQLTYTVSGGQVTALTQNRGDSLVNTSFAFQPSGQNITTETTAGKTTTHQFAGGTYAGIQDPAGNYSAQALNLQLRPDSLTDPNGNRTQFVWSGGGSKLLQQAIDALGQAERFFYNANDTLNYSLDAEGRKTLFTYGDVNNPRLPTRVQFYDKDGTTVLRWLEFTYDTKGRVLTQKLYNTAGSVVQQQMDYAYYNTGNGKCLLQTTTEKDLVTPANNVTTTYFYDTLARVVKVSQSSTFGPCKISYTVYDAADHVIASLCNYDPGMSADPTTVAEAIALFNPATPDKNRVTSYTFDPLGRQIAMTVDAGASYALTTLTGFDSMSRVTRTITNYVAVPGINDPYVHKREDFTHGLNNDQNLIVDFVYNEHGQLKRQIDELGHTTLFGYNDAGRLVRTVRYASQPTYDNSYAAGADPSLAKYAWVASDLPNQDIMTSTEYAAAGNAIKTTDPIGNVTLVGYDTLNRPVRVIQNASQPSYNRAADPTLAAYVPVSASDQDLVTVTEYDAMSRVRCTQDVMGNTTLFGFDGLGRLVKTIRYASQPTYDLVADPSLSRYDASTAPDQDLVSQISYDPAERVMFTTDVLGRKAWLGYDGLGRAVRTVANAIGTATGGSIKDPRSATYGAVISASDVDQIALTNFDASARVWRTQDILGNWTLVGFDSVDRVIRVIRNASNPNYDATADAALERYQPAVGAGPDQDVVTRTIYNAQGRVEATVDPAGNETRYVYDALGRMLKTIANFTTGNFNPTYPDQDLTAVTDYDLGSRVVSTVDVRGTQTTFAHDKACRQRQVTEAAGTTLARTTYTCFDKAGRTLRVIQNWIFDPAQASPDARDTQGNWLFNPGTHGTTNDQNVITTFTLDKAGRPTGVTDPIGNAASLTYYKDGQIEAATDPLGFIAKIRYDKARRQKTAVQAYNASTFADPDTWVWDSADARWEDGTGTAITFGTANDRNSIVQLEYDKAGRTLAQRDPRGKRTTYAFDLLDRRTKLTDPLNRSWATAYSHRNGSQRVTLTDALGFLTERETDRLGRPVKVTYLNESPEDTPDVAFAYDKRGNRTLMRETKSNGTTVVRSTSYAYDQASRAVQIDFDTNGDGTVDQQALYTYEAGGLRTALWHNGRDMDYTYDALGQLTSLADWHDQVTQYTYDGVGRLRTVERSNNMDSTYSFDAASRLTNLSHVNGANAIASFAYTLNALSQRTGVVETQAQAPSGTDTHNLTYAYDALARLTQAVHRSGGTLGSGSVVRQDDYQYDRATNRTQQVVTVSGSPTTTNYTYDNANQLASDGSNTFTYDANGRLTSDGVNSYTWDRANRLLTQGTTAYRYDGDGQRVRLTVDSTITNYYRDVLSEPWTVMRASTGTDATYYVNGPDGFHSRRDGAVVWRWMVLDGLGSVRGAVDSSAAVQESRVYAPYGEPYGGTGSSQTVYGFTGELTDPNSLVYLRARYLSPAIGQFISRDPLETANRYAYVMGNPVNWTDPTGLRVDCGDPRGCGSVTPRPTLPPAATNWVTPSSSSSLPSRFFPPAQGSRTTGGRTATPATSNSGTGSGTQAAQQASPASWGDSGGGSAPTAPSVTQQGVNLVMTNAGTDKPLAPVSPRTLEETRTLRPEVLASMRPTIPIWPKGGGLPIQVDPRSLPGVRTAINYGSSGRRAVPVPSLGGIGGGIRLGTSMDAGGSTGPGNSNTLITPTDYCDTCWIYLILWGTYSKFVECTSNCIQRPPPDVCQEGHQPYAGIYDINGSLLTFVCNPRPFYVSTSSINAIKFFEGNGCVRVFNGIKTRFYARTTGNIGILINLANEWDIEQAINGAISVRWVLGDPQCPR